MCLRVTQKRLVYIGLEGEGGGKVKVQVAISPKQLITATQDHTHEVMECMM